MKTKSENLIYRNYSGSRSSFKAGAQKKAKKNSSKKAQNHIMKVVAVVVLLFIVFSVPVYAYYHSNKGISKTVVPGTSTQPKSKTTVLKPATVAPAVQTSTGVCGSQTGKILVASITDRHLWACDGGQVVYQSAVVTGDMNVVEDATPVGTYQIYSKQTNLYLNGSDSRGSWHDYVNYWMPFLDNQYGTFGLHDATWRADTDFGNISPYSDNSSHGCIELPLATAQWIYNWAPIGTTVTIES